MKRDPYLFFTYDGTFEGILTCVFDAFDKKQFPRQLLTHEATLFSMENNYITTDEWKADRVLKGLKKKLSSFAFHSLFTCWLSELKEVDLLLFNYICKTFTSPVSIELNFADADVLGLSKIYKKVGKEAEMVRQFVRFQETKDKMYFASIKPLYNVLPLVANFFQERFADQQWIIYDIKRSYALYYDLTKTEIAYFDDLKMNQLNGKLYPELLAEEERYFQHTWKEYLQAITIKERKNPNLQRQHMPKRFWKYLTEKQN
ncbi:MAG: TIGR03915 family putative DNA repair protein [Bacteroidales bacterium]|jgi:probable DNA metabolism protein|nr:TIGR03915 family putative DNA repair protein [Bacteroidales bacterium]